MKHLVVALALDKALDATWAEKVTPERKVNRRPLLYGEPLGPNSRQLGGGDSILKHPPGESTSEIAVILAKISGARRLFDPVTQVECIVHVANATVRHVRPMRGYANALRSGSGWTGTVLRWWVNNPTLAAELVW